MNNKGRRKLKDLDDQISNNLPDTTKKQRGQHTMEIRETNKDMDNSFQSMEMLSGRWREMKTAGQKHNSIKIRISRKEQELRTWQRIKETIMEQRSAKDEEGRRNKLRKRTEQWTSQGGGTKKDNKDQESWSESRFIRLRRRNASDSLIKLKIKQKQMTSIMKHLAKKIEGKVQ